MPEGRALCSLDVVPEGRALFSLTVVPGQQQKKQKKNARAWFQRWSVLLSVSVQNSLAATLVEEGRGFSEGDGYLPLSVEVCLSRKDRVEEGEEEQPESELVRVSRVTCARDRQTSPVTLAALV